MFQRNTAALSATILAGVLMVSILPPSARAQLPDDPENAAPDDAARKFQAAAKASAAGYALRADAADGRELKLSEEPLLRWANPLGGRKAHGDVFIWTDEGRPAAVLSLYEYTTPDGVVHEHHEFCSLATGPIFGDGPEGRDWSPPEAGIEFKPLPDSPEPAPSPVRRLSQMRDLAGRFSGAKITREEREKRDLRLLPQPVLRYSSKHHEVTDGALFALVEATDPEIFLVLEARPHEGDLLWHYALARMNSLWLSASYSGQQVWEADVLPWGQIIRRTDKPYMIFPLR
jgi:hypothetical protein